MEAWIDVDEDLPEEEVLVTVRVNGVARWDYYRIEERWYGLEDLNRWRMNTSRYWAQDRTWYLKTEQIEGWKGAPGEGINKPAP